MGAICNQCESLSSPNQQKPSQCTHLLISPYEDRIPGGKDYITFTAHSRNKINEKRIILFFWWTPPPVSRFCNYPPVSWLWWAPPTCGCFCDEHLPPVSRFCDPPPPPRPCEFSLMDTCHLWVLFWWTSATCGWFCDGHLPPVGAFMMDTCTLWVDLWLPQNEIPLFFCNC